MTAPTAAPVAVELYYEIQRFLFREAGLLERRDYAAWLALLTDDIHYRVAARVIRDASASDSGYDIIDETRVGLTSRAEQISNPRLTRAENPASLTRRLITNIDVIAGDGPDEVLATSSFLVFRVKTSLPEGGLYVGERSDTLRKIEGVWHLARRFVRLDQTTLYNGALSVLL